MNILIVGSNSFIGKNLTKKLKKNNKVFSTSKNSKNKYYLDLNYPQNMKLNLEEIDMILYLAYLKKENKKNFQNQLFSIKKIVKLKKFKTKILFFSTIAPSLSEKFSYSFTKYVIEKKILKNNGSVIRMGYVYNNRTIVKPNIMLKFLKILDICHCIPVIYPQYRVYTTNLNALTDIITNMISNKNFSRLIYIIIDKKTKKLNRFLQTLLTNKTNSFNLIKISRNLSDLFFNFFVKLLSRKTYNKYMNLKKSNDYNFRLKRCKIIFTQ